MYPPLFLIRFNNSFCTFLLFLINALAHGCNAYGNCWNPVEILAVLTKNNFESNYPIVPLDIE